MSDELLINASGVTKKFGTHLALDDIHLRVPRGTCHGFLGPNGAGKTTLIRIVLGLARASSGEMVVRGSKMPGNAREVLSRVGAMVEEPRFWPYLTGRHNLEVAASMLDKAAKGRIDQVIDRVGLSGRETDKVKGYSLGMRQRLGLARALLNDPELLVLDEPVNGLDPAGIAEFRDLIRSFVSEEGRTVLLSSHLLAEIEKTCDTITIISHGRTLLEGRMEELMAQGENGLALDADDLAGAKSALAAIAEKAGIINIEDRGGWLFVECRPSREIRATVGRALLDSGIAIVGLTEQRQSLEKRYLELTSAAHAAGGMTSVAAVRSGEVKK